jgi:hypothetical protein
MVKDEAEMVDAATIELSSLLKDARSSEYRMVEVKQECLHMDGEGEGGGDESELHNRHGCSTTAWLGLSNDDAKQGGSNGGATAMTLGWHLSTGNQMGAQEQEQGNGDLQKKQQKEEEKEEEMKQDEEGTNNVISLSSSSPSLLQEEVPLAIAWKLSS